MFVNKLIFGNTGNFIKFSLNNVKKWFVPTRNFSMTRAQTEPRFVCVRRGTSTKPSKLERLKISDNVPAGYELVYRCTMSPYLYLVQVVTTVAAVGAPILACISYDPTNDYSINLPMIQLYNISETKFQLTMFCVAFIAVNVAMSLAIGRFPVRIYSNETTQKYLAFVYGKVPNTKRCFEINPGDLVEGKRGNLLPWNDHSYRLRNGSKIILFDHYFKKPNDLNVMLGHNKF